MRPILIHGRDHIYQTSYDIQELKRKLLDASALPMPDRCVALLSSVVKLVNQDISQDTFDLAVQQFTREDLEQTVAYCVRSKWLNSEGTTIQITHEGIAALERQVAFNDVAGRLSWVQLSEEQRRLLVLEVVGGAPQERGVTAIARLIAGRFTPSANAGSIRSWIIRSGMRESIVRRPKPPGPKATGL